jgi:uncharacterized protein YutD
MVCINNICYEVLKDEREAFNEEAFRGRFIDVLSRYDYIVGDWGYNQLRLRGFFDDRNQKAYCNFGCAYFVLKKVHK